MNKLIIGSAFNYSIQHIQLFLVSLDKVFNGTVVLFSNSHFILPETKFKVIIEYWDPNTRRKDLPVAFNDSINFRHFLYLDYLKKNKHYDAVMLSDVRDVIFQKDPFEQMHLTLIDVAQEDNTIGNCHINAEWIKNVFDNAYFESIADSNIICAGTTIGCFDAILKYETDMVDLIYSKRELDTGDNKMIIDQALHNYWCRINEKNIRRNTNINGPIFTMGHASNITFDRSGLMVNNDNYPFSIIHQYDRFPWLLPMFESKFRQLANPNKKNSISSIAKKIIDKISKQQVT